MGRRKRCFSKENDGEERCVCAAGWENGTQLNLCLENEEGMEDQEDYKRVDQAEEDTEEKPKKKA